jgi:hypothetical protein
MVWLIGFVLHGITVMLGWKFIMVFMFNLQMINFFQAILIVAFVRYLTNGHISKKEFIKLQRESGDSKHSDKFLENIYSIIFPFVFIVIIILFNWLSTTNFAKFLVW